MNFCNLWLDPFVQFYRAIGIEEHLNGVQRQPHAVFREVGCATQIFYFVFPLEQGDQERIILDVADLKAVHAAIISSFGEQLDTFLGRNPEIARHA